jgi:hypothetical protein
MIQPLTIQQYAEIVQEVQKKHCCFYAKGRAIKYIDAHYDTRTGHYFGVTFRGFGDDKVFTTTNRFSLGEKINEFIYEEGNLYDEIMAWLNE